MLASLLHSNTTEVSTTERTVKSQYPMGPLCNTHVSTQGGGESDIPT